VLALLGLIERDATGRLVEAGRGEAQRAER
jgi:hypothetical protein